MKIEEIAKDLIYPSLEMQALEQTKPTVENRPKETFGAKRPHILIAPKEFEFDHDVWTTEHLGYEKGIHIKCIR